ncbi:hypothetical protein [Rhodonellum sp.]|uniref:DUF6992 family protein n=1 Tax=Rhodonellum sp. TaxID=2231180 RepID=UPI00271E8DC7|nr:hypothetical protein [Rhodonellum sp.]MDO9553219.1 hypothetical protein [Rhodonellum sp.]
MKTNDKSNRFWLVLILMAVSFGFAHAQNERGATEFNQTRVDYNKKGMLILGLWAAGNMAVGGVMAGRTSGETKGFHQMNIYWNSVNLAIAGFGYYQATKEIPNSEFWATMEAQQGIEKILLVNAALDVAYMAGGLFLLERGKRLEKDQFKGFGKSIVLQGAFLMGFDVVMYVFHNQNGQNLPKIFNKLELTQNGIGLVFPL